MKTKLFIGALGLMTLAGCRDNPHYCEGAPLDNCGLVDAKPDGGKTCSGDTQCTSPQVCDVQGTKTCVECTVEKDSACTGGKPVCGEDHACRACAAHSECDSGVCLGDGTCAAENTVAYVNGGTGSDAADCNRNTPCKTLGKALGTMRGVVKVSGTVKESGATTVAGRTLKLIGDTGASLDRDGDGPLLTVSGTADVSIDGLTLTGATGPMGSGANGLDVTPNGGQPKVTLRNVTIAGNQGHGLSATGGTVTVTGSTIQNNQAIGLNSSGGTVTVTGSTIQNNQAIGLNSSGGTVTVTGSTFRSNAGGGLKIENAAFKIMQNFIVKNGSDTSAIGGAHVSPVMGQLAEFAYNTVVDNSARASDSAAGGVMC